jgi:MFS family permease
LLVRDASWIWLLYVLTAIQLGISGFFFTTRTAILPDIVDSQGVGTANAITSATWSVMLALGAAAGGLVAGIFGLYPAFVIDGITFFLSAAFISAIRVDKSPRTHEHDRTIRTVLVDYLAGLRFVCGRADMLLIALHKSMLMLFFGSTFQVAQVSIAESVLRVGEKGSLGVGLLFATMGIGTGISPLIARRFTGDRQTLLRSTILVGYLIGAIGLVVASQLSNLTIVFCGTLLVGLGNGILWVFSTQLLLQLAPVNIRGRVFATEFAFFSLASAVGAAIAGVALDQSLSIAMLLRSMAMLSFAPALVWGLWTVSRRR